MSAGATDHERVRPEPPTTYYDGGVKLPGFGDPPDRCRRYTPVGGCENGHTILGRSSCQCRYCRDHWRDWVEKAVISMVERMAAYRYVAEGMQKRAIHAVASPPQDRRYSAREMWSTRGDSYDAVQAVGVRGGPAITHPYRTNDRADELYATAQESGDLEDGTGKWAFLRQITDGWEDMTRYVEAAPHYHIPIAPVEDLQPEAADGWVIKRIRTLKPFYLEESEVPPYLLIDDGGKIQQTRSEVVRDGYEDMVATAYYVLTHGAVQEGKQTTTYFGEAHPASFNPEEELTPEEWSRIQREVERAVKEDPATDGGDGGISGGPDECPHEDCEASVFDLMYLPERLDDEDWCDKVKQYGDGRARLARLHGAVAWYDERTDRPPPSVMGDEERMRNWLENQGEPFLAPVVEPQQVTISTALMSE